MSILCSACNATDPEKENKLKKKYSAKYNLYYSKPSQTPILLYLAQVSMLSKTVSKVCARPIWRRLYANSSNKVGSPESTTESKPKVNRFAKQYADQDQNRNRLQSGSNRTIPRDPNPSNEGPGKTAVIPIDKLQQNRI